MTVLGDEEVVERLIHHMLLLLELSQQRLLSACLASGQQGLRLQIGA